MKAANLEPGSIYAAGFDLSPATVQGVKDGYVDLVIDQQQYLQGFEASQQLCLTQKYGFSGLFINTGGGFVDKRTSTSSRRSWSSRSGRLAAHATPARRSRPADRPGG